MCVCVCDCVCVYVCVCVGGGVVGGEGIHNEVHDIFSLLHK